MMIIIIIIMTSGLDNGRMLNKIKKKKKNVIRKINLSLVIKKVKMGEKQTQT